MSKPISKSTPINNIELNKGEDYEVVGYITDDFDVPLDISGDTFRAEVREKCGGAVIAAFTFSVFLDPDDSIWKYIRSMPQATINGISKNSAVWDQFQESAAGKSNKMFVGDVTINCNITDPTV